MKILEPVVLCNLTIFQNIHVSAIQEFRAPVFFLLKHMKTPWPLWRVEIVSQIAVEVLVGVQLQARGLRLVQNNVRDAHFLSFCKNFREFGPYL